jgi:hypothetical protein
MTHITSSKREHRPPEAKRRQPNTASKCQIVRECCPKAKAAEFADTDGLCLTERGETQSNPVLRGNPGATREAYHIRALRAFGFGRHFSSRAMSFTNGCI